jgi:hypothetical protein
MLKVVISAAALALALCACVESRAPLRGPPAGCPTAIPADQDQVDAALLQLTQVQPGDVVGVQLCFVSDSAMPIDLGRSFVNVAVINSEGRLATANGVPLSFGTYVADPGQQPRQAVLVGFSLGLPVAATPPLDGRALVRADIQYCPNGPAPCQTGIRRSYVFLRSQTITRSP